MQILSKQSCFVVVAVLYLAGINLSVSYGKSADSGEAQVAGVRAMTQLSAEVAVKEGGIKSARLPSNSHEWAELDKACKKSPADFYAWIWGPKAQAVSAQQWSEYGDFGRDPLLFCHEQVKAYEYAKKTSAETEGNDPVIVDQKLEAARFAELAKLEKTAPNADIRYPKTDAEYAAMNEAAKNGVKACMEYLRPDGDNTEFTRMTWTMIGEKDYQSGCNHVGIKLLYEKR